MKPEGKESPAISEMSPVPTACVREDGAFVHVNARFTELFGYDADHLPTLAEWIGAAGDGSGKKRGSARSGIDQLLGATAGEPVSVTCSANCRNGTTKTVLASSVRLESGDYLITCRNVPQGLGREDPPKSPLSLFRAVLECTTDAVLAVDHSGRIKLFNRTFVEMWRPPRAAMDARDGESLFAFLRDQMTDPHGFDTRWDSSVDPEEEEASEILELRDGRVIECRSRRQLLDEKSFTRVWIFHDMTDLVMARASFRTWETRSRLLSENLPVGFISSDAAGMITEINKEAEKMLDLAIPQPAGQPSLTDLGPLVEAGVAGAMSRCMETGQSFQGELPYKSKAGRDMCLRLHVAPVKDDHGTVKGCSAVMEDVTDWKRAEALILTARRQKALGQMAGGVAHTFSNFLQLVGTSANMAMTNLELQEYADIKGNLQQIIKSVKSAGETVRRLQHFSRERPRGEVVRSTTFDLSDAVREAVEICRLWSKAELERRHINVSYKVSLASGCLVRGSRDEITEVALNLLKNAVEALPEGGTITVSTAPENDRAVLRVKDDGVGISRANISHITDPFWTSKNSHAGIGLTINFGIVRRHKGTMGVRILKPSGSMFSVKLPCVKSSLPATAPEPAKTEGRTYRILLIDDDRPVVTILGKGLRKKGNTTFVAFSGPEGLDILRKEAVEVVVCDLGMEGMNGWEVSGAVRGLCLKKGIPKPTFILLSGWAGQLPVDEITYHPYVDRILEKPIAIPRLLEIIGEEVAGSDPNRRETGKTT